jgi:hypothetical protein
MLQGSALAMPDEPKFETRSPMRMRTALRLGLRLRLHSSERDVIFVKRHANERAIEVSGQSVRQAATCATERAPQNMRHKTRRA